MDTTANLESREFEHLIRPQLDYLYRISYRFTCDKSDAEDLVQDLMVKLYPRRSELAHVAQLRPWLVRVLYHLFVDSYRKQKRFPLRIVKNRQEADTGDPVEQIPTSNPDPEAYARRRHLNESIKRALTKLGKKQRAIITLHDIEGYQLTELEPLLSVPLGTLKSRLHRARAKLREILKKNGTF